MGKFDEKRRCPPNGGAAHIREQTLPPLAKSRGYAPASINNLTFNYAFQPIFKFLTGFELFTLHLQIEK